MPQGKCLLTGKRKLKTIQGQDVMQWHHQSATEHLGLYKRREMEASAQQQQTVDEENHQNVSLILNSFNFKNKKMTISSGGTETNFAKMGDTIRY